MSNNLYIKKKKITLKVFVTTKLQLSKNKFIKERKKKIVYRKTEIKVDKLCKIIKIINRHSFPCLLYDKLTVVNSWGVEIDLYLG